MAWMTKDDQTILVDDGAVQYWLDAGWSPDADRDGIPDVSVVHQDTTWTSISYQAGTLDIPDGESATPIQFDTLPEGITAESADVFNIGQGTFLLRYDIEPSQPPEDRVANLTVAFGDDPFALTGVSHYPIPLSSTNTSYASYLIGGSLVITGPLVTVSLMARSATGGGDPLNLDFASISIKRII